MKNLITLASLTLLLTACGGDSDTPSPVAPTLVTGKFIDAPVKGMGYSCSSGQTGTTNSAGEYTCTDEAVVTFMIGGLTIGTVTASNGAITTPYTLFPDDTNAAINLARLLQTLDSPTDDLIDLSSADTSGLSTSVDFTSSSFATEVGISLTVTASDAKANLESGVTAGGGVVPTPTLVNNTAGLISSADFDFSNSRTTVIDIDVPSASTSPGLLSLCTRYTRTGDSFDIDYDSCVVQAPLVNGLYSANMNITNDINSVVSVVWFQDESIPPVYQEFSLEGGG